MGDLFQSGNAVLSDCGRFRYSLTRQWSEGATAVFIMLNPSTADALIDDPTIRRCVNFAKREGCGGLRVENLFGFRATNPDEMFRHAHTAIGATDHYILDAATKADGPVIAAWGADKRSAKRAKDVATLLVSAGATLMCLGKTKDGSPRHPLYVRGDAPLVPYAIRKETS